MAFNVNSKTPTHIDNAKTLLHYMAYDPDFDAFHQFHVTIIHHSKIDPDDEAEKEWVRELMNLLAPEI